MSTVLSPTKPRQQYLDLRASVHRRLLNRLNLEALAQADRSRAEGEIRSLLGQLLADEGTPLNLNERETLFAEVLDDVFGLGPLEQSAKSAGESLDSTIRSTLADVVIGEALVNGEQPLGGQGQFHGANLSRQSPGVDPSACAICVRRAHCAPAPA